MPRDSAQSPGLVPEVALRAAGLVGAASSGLAAATMLLRPGAAAGIAATAADLLILLGIVGLGRQGTGRAGWRLAAACMGANVLAAAASFFLPRVGAGPVIDLFGSLSWLADACAYGVFGVALLLRRAGTPRALGIVAGATLVLRATAALTLTVLQPLESALSLPDFVLLRVWAATSIAAGAATSALFATVRSLRPTAR